VPAQRLCAPHAAPDTLAALAKRWQYHRVESSQRPAHTRDAGKGRPTPCTPLTAIAGPIQAHVQADDPTLAQGKQAQACFVLGTPLDASALRDADVISAYKGQAQVEGGLRFLKAPLFFVASLFVKTPTRIAGVLMVRPLALLVDSVAHRRRRNQ
jgi:hypothetical protein